MIERLGLGCATFVSEGRGVPEDEAVAILESAYAVGIRFFDTAHMYGGGRSEELIGEVLADHRSTLMLCTKGGVDLRDLTDVATIEPDSSASALRRQLDQSLRRMRTDHVDLFLLHRPDPRRTPEEQMESLAIIRDEGLALQVGLSNFAPADCERALATGIPTVVEYSFSLVDDRNFETLDAAHRMGARRITFGTFAHGLLAEDLTEETVFGQADWRRRSRQTGDSNTSGNFLYAGAAYEANLRIAAALRELATERGLSLGAFTLAMTLDSGLTDTVLVGARSTSELADDLTALTLDVADEERGAVATMLAEHGRAWDGSSGPVAR